MKERSTSFLTSVLVFILSISMLKTNVLLGADLAAGEHSSRLYFSESFDDAKWHCVEAMFKLNSLNMKNDKPNSNGWLRGWFDGKLVVERNDVVFRSTDFPEIKFNQFLLTPYFGPGLLPHAQTLWIDELAVGNQRIGRFKKAPYILTPKSSDKHRKEGGKDVRGTGFQPVKTRPGWPCHLPLSSGEYLGHKWHIDENHLMWWDGKPYVPFGGFGITPGNEFGLNSFNLWIDFDPFIEKPRYTRKQHRAEIARKLDAITKAGGTCIVQFSMALPHIPEGPKPGMRWREPEGGIDGSRLADPEVKRAILKVWEYYAPAVRKECVRAIVLWNEINVWRWPKRMSVDKYGQVLSEYAREVKRMVGDLPVCFKVAGTWNAAAVIAGAAAADGLGFDVWFTKPDDARAKGEIERALWMLEGRQKKTTWFFIAEGGRGIAEGGTDEAKDVENYWDNWPPFRSKTEAQGILQAYARSGVKGFIYNGPTSELRSKYHSSYRWLGELKPEITALMVETKRLPPETRLLMTAEQAVAAARADERVWELLRGLDDVRSETEFSEQWQVWLVHFSAGDHRVGFASVSEDGKVLEVGAPEESDKDNNHRSEKDDGAVRSRSTFRFPIAARVHVPDSANTSTLVTAETLRSESFRRRLAYQFVLVENENQWTLISHRSAVPNAAFPTVDIRATDDGLALTLHDVKQETVQQVAFATMDEAIADYQEWIERTYCIGHIGKHANKPAWLANVRQVFTIDLWRPHGEITQDFADVTRFLEELHRAGAPKDTLLYLCGWSSPYDARYPEYQPAEELGGVEKFQQLVETAHRYGYRVMIHTCPVAFDPWLASFEHFDDCTLKGEDHPGGFRGWPGGYHSRKLDFDSGKQTAGKRTVTVRVPDKCEARLTVGGFGSVRPNITVRDRTLAIPPDAPDPYTFPFTFFFDKGRNQITFSSAPRGLWYRLHESLQFIHVWTYPFVGMDPKSAKWRDYFTQKVVAVVKKFNIDAVHLDAHPIGGSTWDCLGLFEQVMEALPGVAFSAEEGLGEIGLKVFGLTQGCWVGEEEMLSRSPLCRKLTSPYIRHYWHLVGARSFVPVGVVWNLNPPSEVTAQSQKQLKRDLARGERLGVIKTLRVNTRKFGLDDETRQAVAYAGR
jgi:hypothetical protein